MSGNGKGNESQGSCSYDYELFFIALDLSSRRSSGPVAPNSSAPPRWRRRPGSWRGRIPGPRRRRPRADLQILEDRPSRPGRHPYSPPTHRSWSPGWWIHIHRWNWRTASAPRSWCRCRAAPTKSCRRSWSFPSPRCWLRSHGRA